MNYEIKAQEKLYTTKMEADHLVKYPPFHLANLKEIGTTGRRDKVVKFINFRMLELECETRSWGGGAGSQDPNVPRLLSGYQTLGRSGLTER